MNLVLDTGILGQFCHPESKANKNAAPWLEAVVNQWL